MEHKIVIALLITMATTMWNVHGAPANAGRTQLYRSSLTDGNKSTRDEVAYLKESTGTLQVYGRYTFVAPSGIVATVYYYADENGYRAKSVLGADAKPAGDDVLSIVGPLGGFAPSVGGETEKNPENEILPPDVLKSLLG